jgi:hypothetical protein
MIRRRPWSCITHNGIQGIAKRAFEFDEAASSGMRRRWHEWRAEGVDDVQVFLRASEVPDRRCR